MKKHVKALALSLCLLIGLTTGCAPKAITPTSKDGNVYSKDSIIFDVVAIEMITGDTNRAYANGKNYNYQSISYSYQ